MESTGKLIDEILACSGIHYHELLRKAAHLTRNQIRGQTLRQVKNSLASLGCQILNQRDGGDSEYTEFEIESNFKMAGVSSTHDLTLQIHSWGVSPKHDSMPPTKVYRANFAMVSCYNSSLSNLLATTPFEFDSVGDLMLRSKILRDENSAWPIVNKICIFYEYIANHHRESNPHAFHGEFDFSSHYTDPVARKHFCLSVESGLDPWCSHSGEWTEYRNPNELGVVEFSGSGQTGKWPTGAG